MKKIISILLAVLMLAATITCACVAFADEGDYTCHCESCLKNADCKCCVYCPYTSKVIACVQKHGGENGEAVFCCEACTGFLGCRCGEGVSLCDCDACKLSNQTGEYPYSGQTQLIDSETQKDLIKIFRSVLEKLSEIFDKLFDAINEFLRIDEFFGRTGD
ncbi:MAG: hypothetical protein MJ177_04065 [Clostridia bacterium]|nr:hypothetical protein [Clostridia bacterium]